MLGLLGFLSSHMINLVLCEILLPLRSQLLICSLIQLSAGTVLRHVAWQSTLETRTKSLTSLRGSILLVQGYRTRGLQNILHGLLHDWMDCFLLRAEHWKTETLCLKVGMLHRELRTLILELQMRAVHQWVTHERGSEELTRLRNVMSSVAS
jgi:hypothetical protein